jgi:chitin-binding protein
MTIAFVASFLVIGLCLCVTPSLAHGYVSNPPSRQAQCKSGVVKNCGQIMYEPQSVEAPKGRRQCSGGIGMWSSLDDNNKGWKVTSVGSSVTVTWTLTAVHKTANWEYYLGNTRLAVFTGTGTTHTVPLGGLTGRQTILAIWNIGDTANAFYNCIDLQIGGGSTSGGSTSGGSTSTTPSTPPVTRTPTSSTCKTTYIVKSGDYMGKIAASQGTTVAKLQAANPQITNMDLIYVGQTVYIPKAACAYTTELPTITAPAPTTDKLVTIIPPYKITYIYDRDVSAINPVRAAVDAGFNMVIIAYHMSMVVHIMRVRGKASVTQCARTPLPMLIQRERLS